MIDYVRNVLVVGIRAQPCRRRYVSITGVHTVRALVGGAVRSRSETEAMRLLARRYRDIGLVAVVAAASLVIGAPADAATCALPVRYSTTSDTIYLTTPSSVDTLTEIKAACPGAPLVQPSPGVWELNSDLVVQGGARLNLSGDVKELRLQSLPSGLTKDVSALIAQYGTIHMTGVKVTSWNGTGPDTDPTMSTGGRGRAFVRAVSFMEGSTPRQSTLNIVNSNLGFLGYNAAES